MLRVDRADVAYGDAAALTDVSLHVDAGELVAVIGPNGAGKTTLVNAIAGLLPLRRGQITIDGLDATCLSPQQRGARGVAIIPEGRRLFGAMTVEENLEIGCYRSGPRARRIDLLTYVYGLFPILRDRRRQLAGTMSGGQQQMVAIARALMSEPKLLLIDEPSLGLAPIVISQVFETLASIHAQGLSILLIEQNATRALAIAQRAYVIDCGRLVADGPCAALAMQPEIAAAYLGHAPA